MTLSLLGMELWAAKNLLNALNMPYSVQFYYALKPLPDPDSMRVIRQAEVNGSLELTVGAFKTKIN